MAEKSDSLPSNVVVVDFDRSASKNKPAIKEIGDLNAEKRHLFQEYLKEGVVSVMLDATSDGVKVPEDYAQEQSLVLNFAYAFHVPDFNFNDVGIWATLSFNSGEHFCMVPWTSVIGMRSEAPTPEKVDNNATVIEFDFSSGKPA